jgi:hypothetical protein
MKIIEAKKQVTRLRFVAVVIIGTSTLFFIFAALKSIYFLMEGDRTVFSSVSLALQRLIYFIYERTQFASWIWDLAPVVNPREINTAGNLGFCFIALCGAIGRIMWDSAAHLSSRIAKTIQRVEELGWEQALLAQQGIVAGMKPDVLQINIELDQKDQWYKRPTGLLLIGIAIAVLGQWANLKFGLVK